MPTFAPMRLVYLFLAFVWTQTASAQISDFQFNEPCRLAYKAIMAGKLKEGQQLISQEKKSNPKNLIPVLLDNYVDYISLTFNEQPEVFARQKKMQALRLDAIDKGNKNSPYYLLCKALVYQQWSLIRAKNDDKWNAVWDYRRAHLLLVENKKRFPEFAETDIFLGASEAIISTIPAGYMWIIKILGLRGDMDGGMVRLEKQVMSKKRLFADEANLYFIFLTNYLENDSDKALRVLSELSLDTKENWLNCFIAANLYLNRKEAAKAEKLIRERTQTTAYMVFPMLDYELGDAKLKRLDFSCVNDYKRYLAQSKSLFYIKDAWLSIAYAAYLQGDMAEVKRCFEHIKQEGSMEADADREAMHIAEKGILPDKDLLRTRLLSDGGYNREALAILKSRTVSSFKRNEDQLEYVYRMARIYDALKKEEEALGFYVIALQQAGKTTAYYPARAALQMGYIYESRRDTDSAMYYFNRVLQLKGHEYKNSLDQKAKAAINRIKGT